MIKKILITLLLPAYLVGCIGVKESSPITISAQKSGVEYGRCIYKVKLTNTSTRSKSRIEWVMADLFLKDSNGVQIGREGMFLKTSLRPGESALFNEKVNMVSNGSTAACKKAVSYVIEVKKISYY